MKGYIYVGFFYVERMEIHLENQKTPKLFVVMIIVVYLSRAVVDVQFTLGEHVGGEGGWQPSPGQA